MAMMHAIRVHQFGGPGVLKYEEVPVPECGADQVLVRVHAAGVGPWDAWVRGGHSVVPQPLPLTPGSDVCGEVVAIGSGAGPAAYVPGDAVFGATNARFTNGYADYALCNAGMLATKPVSLSDVEAASAPVVAVTAWQMLFDHAKLRAGETVFIQGAGGNVGGYAVQLALHAGLLVQVTAADRGKDSPSLSGCSLVDAKAKTHPVDAVIDLVGGQQQSKLFDMLTAGGRLISAVAEPDKEIAAARGIEAALMLVEVNSEGLAKIGQLFDTGELKPWVGTVLPLQDARMAHEIMAGTREHIRGKIVLQPKSTTR